MPAGTKGYSKGKDSKGKQESTLASKGQVSKGKPKGRPDDSCAANASYSGQALAATVIPKEEGLPCKFFGSAKGCSSSMCPFSHSNPNSVAPCSFHQRGFCEKGEACTFRHFPWASSQEAERHYAAREAGIVETSSERYKKLRGESISEGSDKNQQPHARKLAKEHVELEGEIEREFQEETYGSMALRMMEKMGYKPGSGLGKDSQGRTSLLASCAALEHAAATQGVVLGQGHFVSGTTASAASRAARLADARAQKRPRVENDTFVQHNLLSSDESSDGEAQHVKARAVKLDLS